MQYGFVTARRHSSQNVGAFRRVAEGHIPSPSAANWEKATVACLVLLTSMLDCLHLPSLNNENTYYATAVKSMLASWHNFFFVAFDSAGFLAVDKPPLGLWAQAASARLFGFSVIGLLLPEIVAGSASVLLLYYLVRRWFGGSAGIVAGAVLALTPIDMVTNRDNIMDSLLVATSLAAAWAVLRASELASFKWLALCAVFLGIGFNIKMLEAYLILPACVLTYLAATRQKSLRRCLGELALFGCIVVGISGAWVVAVDLTPPSTRPYVDSTTANSEMDLVFNYNGIQRLVGQPLYGRASRPTSPSTGPVGPVRLLQPQLGGQVSWLLPLALFGLLAATWQSSPGSSQGGQRRRGASLSMQGRAYLFWVTWLITAGAFFSAAHFFNLYYLVMLSPPIAALVGIGAIALFRSYLGGSLRWWLLPAAVLATGVEQTLILSAHATWHPWLLPLVGVGTISAASVLIVLQTRSPTDVLMDHSGTERMVTGARLAWQIPVRILMASIAGLSLGILLLAPLSWLAASYQPTNEGGFPVSGPIVLSTTVGTSLQTDPRLIAYLETHAHNATFLVATTTVKTAIPIMWATGEPVMALGGYSGYDPILTPARLAAAVQSGRVRLFLLPSANLSTADVARLYPEAVAAGRSFQTQYTNQLTYWVSHRCTAVPPAEWQTDPGLTPLQLFFCDR